MRPLVRLAFVLVLGGVGVSGLGAAPWQGFTALVASPDGHSLATGGRGGQMLWLEASTGEVRGRWTLPEGPVVALAFEGGRLGAATVSGRYSVDLLGSQPQVLDDLPQNAALVRLLVQGQAKWMQRPPLLRGTSLGGEVSIGGSVDGVITVTGTPTATWKAHDAAITGLVLLPGTSRLVSASYDGTLALWDLDGTPRGRL